MKIKLVTVGKIKESFYREAVSEYAKRLSRFASFEVIEVDDEKTADRMSPAEINAVLDTEGERLLRHIGDREYVTVLDIKGKKLDSEGLAETVKNRMNDGFSTLTYVIGGSLGLSDAVKQRADLKLSFSDMTFPHQLMRVILSEQIYRAFKIINHEPYHK